MADPKGVPWVPWNPSFEGLPSKILYAQTYYEHYAHTGATHSSFNSSNNARVSTPVSRIQCAHGPRARIYYQKHVATIETMSEASERIKAYSCIAFSAPIVGMVICYQYESAYFPAPYADNQVLCILCGPKWNHTFNSAGFKHNNQV